MQELGDGVVAGVSLSHPVLLYISVRTIGRRRCGQVISINGGSGRDHAWSECHIVQGRLPDCRGGRGLPPIACAAPVQ